MHDSLSLIVPALSPDPTYRLIRLFVIWSQQRELAVVLPQLVLYRESRPEQHRCYPHSHPFALNPDSHRSVTSILADHNEPEWDGRIHVRV